MTSRYAEDLDALVESTLEMGHLAVDLARDGEKVLLGTGTREGVAEKYERLRRMDEDIESDALRILILYQPMSKDMRLVASILKMLTYFERIGNYGNKLAMLASTDCGNCAADLREMANISVSMVIDAIKAFDARDSSKMREFRKRDDRVDELQASISKKITNALPKSVQESATMMDCLMGARFLERMGDHACKVAEKVIYAVEGKKVRID
ncbi:MAG: phosphate signaling complex protein PhoU [Thermoplasmatales archaeon]|nr:phosphate signaling complex protein PhoU [Thermoplasmatales archaeon]